MSNQELITNAIAKMSNEEKALIFPPITRKNFVVRKSWLGRNNIRQQQKSSRNIQP